MRKFLFALVLSLVVFTTLNFLYCNLDSETFNYPMVFKFSIPGLIALRSVPLPAGFVMIAAFCLGIVSLSLIQALPSFYRSLATRAHRKRIKDLEKEVEALRDESIGSASEAKEFPKSLNDSL
ncbi:MAG: bZIP transcription factor [Deltaproteobacteria bacterium]|nr:bZIP transcription factor [Deltaproteobacteria bacterium]